VFYGVVKHSRRRKPAGERKKWADKRSSIPPYANRENKQTPANKGEKKKVMF